MFSDDYRYYLWKTIHLLVYIVQKIIKSYDDIKSNIHSYFSETARSDKIQIEQCKQLCDKIPQHIVLILGEKKLEFTSLSNIVAWATMADIKSISIYDYTGTLLDKKERFFKHLEKEKNLFYDTSSRNLNHGSVIYKNGVRHSMSLNILDPRRSKFQMSKLCRHIAQSGDSTDDINVNYVDKIISESEPNFTDPDLGLYFDDVCCTFGLLPWQLRLTEFIKVEFRSRINVKQFLNALYSYSKCEQRFGK